MSVRRFILLYAKKGIRIKMFRIVCLVIGYMVGCMETAYFVSKAWKTDLRSQGSGNLGTTNALRVLGVKAGAATFAGDILKSVLAFAAGMFLFPEAGALAGMYGSIGAILGHDFPFYLHFRGGKGIAATAGLFVSLDPVLMVIAAVSFVLSVAVTKYVSAGSVLVVIELMAGVLIYGFLGKWGLAQPHLYELYAITAFLTVLALYRHKKNIKGLINGTERKLGQKAD